MILSNSGRLKRTANIVHPSSGYGSTVFEWIHTFFLAIVIAGVLNCAVFQIIVVEQHSMEPTLHDGSRVFLSKSAYSLGKPKCGDIVVFYEPNYKSNFIKRVIGLPGDDILIQYGSVYRNGELLDEPYIREEMSGYFRITVPEGCYFCMGDNRNYSIDSRDKTVGCIPLDRIKGKVLFVK